MGNINRLYRLSEDFKRYIKDKNSKKNSSSSYGTYYRSGEFTSIYFYPWSKVIGNSATYFSTIDKFVNQMKEWGIEVSDIQKELMKKNNISYCVCKPNSTELLIRDRYLELKDALDEYLRDDGHSSKKTLVPTLYQGENGG